MKLRMPDKLKLVVNRNGYCYKYGPIYLGWIVKYVKTDESIPYFDNTPTIDIFRSSSIEHLVIGFTQKQVLGKLGKYLNHEKGETVTEPAQNGPDVIYICDGHGCDSRNCTEEGFDFCKHTTDISHAANFVHLGDGKYMEKVPKGTYQDGYEVGVARGYEAGYKDGYTAGKEVSSKQLSWWD